MLLLAIDTTTTVCSVALGEKDKLWAEITTNTKKTHSQRLMPAVQALLREAGVDKKQLQGIVVAHGPGSFTGIRIGMATAQGLAQGLDIPMAGVMTLDALAEGCAFASGLICPLLDARREQVYTCFYRGGTRGPQAMGPPEALSLDELITKAKDFGDDVIFTGDALGLFRKKLRAALGTSYSEAPFASRLNRAALVLQKGHRDWEKVGPVPAYELKPFYIRLPEAERRLREQRRGQKE
ncbi:MAG TPA: tRNA (adenosine(37)-N6)-threonylcarbamoyltransferase complex dimerization subunit type 1 TsaB [Firmicutes bacterium]|jgi:tRNA threonylcarbamoyladenosine biosynthesis protein TsaB|nr:tRNA (adenosine(37)-N6)-threonylcarbamoyltransferase complex dimerization subunit type 1 TsaB [Bacillota bacterium]